VIVTHINEIIDANNVENLRFLAFGTSKTAGSGVNNLSDTYPYLLSSEATNLAIRSSGPNFPSICTQTLVGDKTYDVIMLEFFDEVTTGLKQLAQRLRQRFPHATIIFIQLMYPGLLLYRDEISMYEWLEEKGFPIMERVGMKLREELKATSSSDWKGLNKDAVLYKRAYVEDVATSVGGYILKGPPVPIENFDNIDTKEWLLSTMDYFSADWYHPSEKTHIAIAKAVKEFLKNNSARRSDEVGTWGAGDLCHKWFSDGNVNIPFSDGVTLEQFKPGKYALQFPSTGGNLFITNPFEQPRSLVLSYMETGPTTTIYPKTQVKINDSNNNPVVIEPVCNTYSFPVHVTSTANVGIVSPGENIVSIMPLETTEEPFRVVATYVINGDEEFFPDIMRNS